MARKQANPYLQSEAAVNKALVDGVGGMQFTAMSPPGIGRLIRIPFYIAVAPIGFAAAAPSATPATVTTAIGNNTGISTTVPTTYIDFAAVAATGGVTNTATLQTPQISWATLRIVGFECIRQDPMLPPADVGDLSFSDLQIGGGANLFVHEDFAPSGIYLAGQDSFAGLRDYPILKSPNTSTVRVQGVGQQTSARLAFSASLVCEILVDDNYGAHVPGPYARAGALVRQGGSFV
jgi:hypothetical protein